MKIKRKKVISRHLLYFEKQFGFKAPYQVLLDGTFCLAALRARVNLMYQIPLYLGDAKMVTTVCAVKEIEELVEYDLYGAMCILKQFAVRKCGHEKSPISATECFLSMIGRRNETHYVIATEDKDLRQRGRRVAGTPILYFNHNTPVLEKPSFRSVIVGEQIEKRKYRLSDAEKKVQKTMKKEIGKRMGEKPAADQPKRHRRRVAKAPNPLCCKKKKVKPVPAAPVAPPPPKEEGPPKKKRIRVKIAKHVKEHYRALAAAEAAKKAEAAKTTESAGTSKE